MQLHVIQLYNYREPKKFYNYTFSTPPFYSLLYTHNVLYVFFKTRYLLKPAYVEIKCQLDATEVFIADLIACSTCFGHHYAHHQELKSIIQAPDDGHSDARNMLSKQ